MIGVLIRVHDRMSDLEVCVDVLHRHWHLDDCHVTVVSNGRTRGATIPDAVRQGVNGVLEIEANPGHFSGNAQLLQAGMRVVPDTCTWTILLEADTWIFGDAVLRRYIQRLEREDKVWASAVWVEKFYTLATDVAIVRTSFVRDHPRLFQFVEPPGPEAWVHNYLRGVNQEPIYIREHMPVHIPALMRRFYNKYGGRFRTFSRARMVTHHIEDLDGGIDEKKRISNELLGRREFPVGIAAGLGRRRWQMELFEALRPWVPRSTWFRKRKWRAP